MGTATNAKLPDRLSIRKLVHLDGPYTLVKQESWMNSHEKLPFFISRTVASSFSAHQSPFSEIATLLDLSRKIEQRTKFLLLKVIK
jgi:hypothetical protein